MDFCDFRTQYEVLKKMDVAIADVSEIEFYVTLQQRIEHLLAQAYQADPTDKMGAARCAYNQASAEMTWIRLGRPYYKLYPAVTDMLVESSLDIPSEYVRAPLGSILLRFPVDYSNSALMAEGRMLRTLLVTEWSQRDMKDTVAAPIDPRDKDDTRRFVFWMDFGEQLDEALPSTQDLTHSKTPMGGPVLVFQLVSISDEQASFEEHFEEWINREKLDMDIGLQVSNEIVANAVRVAVGACLLANGADSRVVEHDVLNKHVRRYRASKTEADKTTLFEKAKRRGKFGWLVGREISLPSVSRSSGESVGTGVSLTRSHWRKGHFHRVRYGPNRSLVKVAWYRPTIVRPDLPAQESRRGYKTQTD